ncbi:trans-aconitate 2-methyltransferase [Gulosibacter sp. 10]|uniref:class I SAM-dependent methyltransferase n=1 Tax=Gulosibacter sp. 10 TaxID=1255570 RepID=UPI00097ECD8E|nr:class I SAM-dependent methyltransferase [Gulosibacter sp. 10]SJM65042.1 hypothetical protein FM112_10570 [Gulosibacter sp. 10]
MTDPYLATASAYDLYALPYRAEIERALEAAVPLFRPDRGPILEIGAGSGANAGWVLDRLPAAHVLALEPSAAMRSLALGRIAGRPDWHPRITVRPEGFFDRDLPAELGGAVALGVLGHFDVGERAAVLAELAARLPAGGGVVLDLQAPARPAPVEPYEFTAATVGEIAYRGIAEARPIGGEAMRWRMTYIALDGDRVLTEETTEHVYHHPAPETFDAEAERAGFEARPLDETSTFRLLERR